MGRKNSFDAIRLFAAVIVVFSHSFAVVGLHEPTIGIFSIGGLGIWIFFILSGYLIAKSWDQYPRFNVFFAKRILRIFPALLGATVATIVVCGFFFTTLSLGDYFSDQGTLDYLNNIFLYNISYLLPGTFTSNPLPTINGSIWSLAYEFTMYIVIAVIGVFKLYKRISAIKIWIALLIMNIIITALGTQYFDFELFHMHIDQLLPLALLFFSGVVMHKAEGRIKLDTGAGVVSLALFFGLSVVLPTAVPIAASVFLAYALFAFGKYEHLAWIGKFGDFSYGIYIYSFVIQQMIYATTNTHNPLKLFALSLLLSLGVAALSWHFIEIKALKFKTKINFKKYPLAQADEAW